METIDDVIAKIKEVSPEIPVEYITVLKHLKQAEGGVLHYNAGETDITNGYGIYRGANPDNIIWAYYESLGKKYTNLPTSKWTKDIILKVNAVIDQDIDLYLSYAFYLDYFKGAHLELFNKDLVILVANLYTNSKKGAWLSIQEGIWDMFEHGLLQVSKENISILDGSYGEKTKKNLLLLKDIGFEKTLIFKLSIILAMKSHYIDLSTSNSDKFLKYLSGWNNRMEHLEHQ